MSVLVSDITDLKRQVASIGYQRYVEYISDPTDPRLARKFSSEERRIGLDAFVNFRGIRAAGKTSWTQGLVQIYPEELTTLPMVMCRELRPALGNLAAEVDGVDFIRMTRREFDACRRRDEFLFSFRLWDIKRARTGRLMWKATPAGLLVDTVKQVIKSGKRGLGILSPGVDYHLQQIFPLMGCFMVIPDPADYAHYLRLRGLTKDEDEELTRNREDAIDEEATRIPNVQPVVNSRFEITESSQAMWWVTQFVLQPRAYTLFDL